MQSYRSQKLATVTVTLLQVTYNYSPTLELSIKAREYRRYRLDIFKLQHLMRLTED